MQEIKRLLNNNNVTAIIVAFIISIFGFAITQPDLDTELYNKQKQDYIENYHTSIVDVIKRADNMLLIDIFAEDNDASVKNIEKTKRDYMRVENLQLTMDNDRVTRSVLSYTYISIITVVLMLYIIYNTCDERKNGMLQITYSAYAGRKKLAVKRSIFFLIAPIIVVICMYAANICVACIMYGFDDWRGPIQTIADYANYTYLHSKVEFLVISVLRNAFYAGIITLVVYMICNIFYNIGIALLAIGTVLVSEWWLFANISNTSVLKNLKNINIFVLFDGNYFDREYLNVNIFGWCVSGGLSLLVGSVILLIISFVLSVFFYRQAKPKLPGFIKKIIELVKISGQKFLFYLPYSFKEAWKLLIIKKGILLAGVMVLVCVVIWNNSIAKFGQRNLEIDEIYNQYGSYDWNGFEDYVKDFSNTIDDKMAQAEAIKEAVIAGTEDISRLMEADMLTIRAQAARLYLDEYEAKLAYHDRLITQRNIDVGLVAERKIDAAFGERSDRREILYGIVIIVFVILFSSWSFEVEQSAGIASIISPTKRSLKWVYCKKYMILTMLIILCLSLVYGCEFIKLIQAYELQSFDVPVQSVNFWENVEWDITIGGYVAIIFVTKIVYILLIQGLTMCFASGKKVVNRSYTLLFMISAAIGFVLLNGVNYVTKTIVIPLGIFIYVILIWLTYKRWRRY